MKSFSNPSHRLSTSTSSLSLSSNSSCNLQYQAHYHYSRSMVSASSPSSSSTSFPISSPTSTSQFQDLQLFSSSPPPPLPILLPSSHSDLIISSRTFIDHEPITSSPSPPTPPFPISNQSPFLQPQPSIHPPQSDPSSTLKSNSLDESDHFKKSLKLVTDLTSSSIPQSIHSTTRTPTLNIRNTLPPALPPPIQSCPPIPITTTPTTIEPATDSNQADHQDSNHHPVDGQLQPTSNDSQLINSPIPLHPRIDHHSNLKHLSNSSGASISSDSSSSSASSSNSSLLHSVPPHPRPPHHHHIPPSGSQSSHTINSNLHHQTSISQSISNRPHISDIQTNVSDQALPNNPSSRGYRSTSSLPYTAQPQPASSIPLRPSRYLLTVIPPISLPHDPPHPRTSPACAGYGPPNAFRLVLFLIIIHL